MRQPNFLMTKKRFVRLLIFLAVFVVILYAYSMSNIEPKQPETEILSESISESPSSAPESSSEPEMNRTKQELHTLLYQVGKFGPDAERKGYVSEEMILEVPRMDCNGPVYDGTDDETLRKGPGLFPQAQLPGPENRNVSIAAHRDVHGKEFYDIDKMTDGDYMYLTYKGKKYVYLFEDSFVTTEDDWEPIRTKDYSCITLQSCTPINVASHRIFVVGRLVDIIDLE